MPARDPDTPLTVSELNREAKRLLESGMGRLWVEGEISNIARPASGHVYFRLKDSGAQISAAWFRQRQRGPTIGLKEGDQVLAYGRISLFEARGDYQLIVEQVEPAGEGVLKREYEKLRNKLAAEGLFDEHHKQELPSLPRCVGIITSPSGAAVRDILTVMRRRFPQVPVIIYPAAVQGAAAPGELLSALQTANRRGDCDVLILGRGGGSLEDLWGFNDETLARAIAASDIPVVSAVGHEIDFTIADFVADARAATPSAAAELVVPDRQEWQARLDSLQGRLALNQSRLLDDRSQALDYLQRRLMSSSPKARVRNQRLMLSELRRRLGSAMREGQHVQRERVIGLDARLRQASPNILVQAAASRLAALRTALAQNIEHQLSDRNHRLALSVRALNSVSPLATLERGYAIVSDSRSGKALTDAALVEPGQRVTARLAKGEFTATVDEDPGRK